MKQPTVLRMLSWSALDQFFRIGFQFLAIVVLARILTPADFGVIAMLGIFVELANTLANAGLTDALIQRKDTTHEEESSLFCFTVVLALAMALTLCVTAHWIANFYAQPLLKNVTYAIAFGLFIRSLGAVQTALFSKLFDFRTTALISGVSGSVSGAIAVIAALAGWGVWSLVLQTIIAAITSTSLLWAWHPWRPQFTFNLKLIRPYLKFGGYLLISRLINVVTVNLYTLIIGKQYTPQEVGFFNRASNFQNLLINSMSGIVAKVAFPVFASAADDHARVERGLSNALLGTAFISVPISISMVLLAGPIILTIFGNQWMGSIPILEILGLEVLIWPLHLLNVNLLMSMGRGDLMLRGVLVKFIVIIAMLLLAAPYGVTAMAKAYVFSSFINLFVNVYFTKKILPFGPAKQLRAIAPCLLAGIPMVVVILLVRNCIHLNHFAQLFVGLATGGTAYLGSSMLLGIHTLDFSRLFYRAKS